MKALLISESLNSAEKLKPFLGSYNFEIIHYRSPVKVIDNLQEISPNAVIINALGKREGAHSHHPVDRR